MTDPFSIPLAGQDEQDNSEEYLVFTDGGLVGVYDRIEDVQRDIKGLLELLEEGSLDKITIERKEE